jgi:hypothetical protein
MHQDQGDASQSIHVRIWEIVYIWAFGPRDRENQSSQSRSHRTIQSNIKWYDMEVGENLVRVFY